MRRLIILTFVIIAITLSACNSNHNLSNSSAGGAENIENTMQSDGVSPSQHSGTQADGIGPSEATAVENNPEIKAVVSKNCNYIYHMLSVADCGYQNEYGSQYRSLHSEADLRILKKYEQLLTVAGGEHQGALYFLCVALPASMDDDISVPTYFKALADVFTTGEIERCFNAYQAIYIQAFSPYTLSVNLDSFRWFYTDNNALKKEIVEIAEVMHRNYEIYVEKVWETSLAELSVITEELNNQFAKIDYVGKWEDALNTQYKQNVFLALMCNSIDNGAQAIDISDTKDVFYHYGEYASTVKMISHEFGIYLLFDELADTVAFKSYSAYELTEALAEYYNIAIAGEFKDNWNYEYIDFYKQLKEREPEISVKEMFLRAVEHYNI